MKVIEGKHYVSGGPACVQIFWEQDPMEVPESRNQVSIEPHGAGCNFCHGTGLQAVEEWPDAVKAEWLNENGKYKGVSVFRDTGTENWAVRKTMLSKTTPYYIRPETISLDADFSAALTAAVIAVAEEAE